MGSKYFGGSHLTDFNNNFTNIDTLLEAITKMQELEGIEPTFKESEYYKTKKDPDKDEKSKCSHNCKACNAKCSNRDENIKERNGGRFLQPFSTFEVEDDNDGEVYVCEYCDVPGYSRRYKPETCDSCTICESCNEYVNDECSGCEYSPIRDGIYYRDKLPENAFIADEELSVLNNLEYGKEGGERFTRGSFSVLKMQ